MHKIKFISTVLSVKSSFVGLITAIIVTVPILGENFTDSWPDGKLETLKYEIITYGQLASKGYNTMTINRTGGNDDIIRVTQELSINDSAVTIYTEETYHAANLALIESQNRFVFSPEAKITYGTDTLTVTAHPAGERLEIIASDTLAVSCRIPLSDDLVTGIGAMLLGRSSTFEIGWSRNYRQINLINITGKPYEVQDVTDSVVNVENVALASGNYDCYKVMKIIPELIGYSYYSKDKNHIPVMIEAFDRTGSVRIMSIYLTGRE